MQQFAGFFSGTAVLLEKKHRRIELALYVFSHALQSAYRCLMEIGVACAIPHGETLLFMG